MYMLQPIYFRREFPWCSAGYSRAMKKSVNELQLRISALSSLEARACM